MDEIDYLLAKEDGEKIGRNRTIKWILFLMSYKRINEIKDLLKRTIERDEKKTPGLKDFDRY